MFKINFKTLVYFLNQKLKIITEKIQIMHFFVISGHAVPVIKTQFSFLGNELGNLQVFSLLRSLNWPQVTPSSGPQLILPHLRTSNSRQITASISSWPEPKVLALVRFQKGARIGILCPLGCSGVEFPWEEGRTETILEGS